MTSVRAGVARSEGVLQLDLARARDVAREILARGGVARGAAFDREARAAVSAFGSA